MSTNEVMTRRFHLPNLMLLGAALVLGLLAAAWPKGAFADWHTLTGPLPPHVSNFDYKISPDSRTVVFIADIDEDDVFELYSVPLTSTTPIKLNPPLVGGGDVSTVYSFTPDGASVVYRADQDVDNQQELYIVPVDGGTSVKLSGTMVAGGNVGQFKLDAASGRVVYMADQETNEIVELWSVPLTGGAPIRLNQPLASGANVSSFAIDPFGAHAVFTADATTDGLHELFSVPLTGGTVVKLNPPIISAGGGDSGIYGEFALNPTLPVVAFIARESGAPRGNLYSIPTETSDPATDRSVPLNFNLLATQRLLSFKFSAFGDRVIFNVSTNNGSGFPQKGQLYSTLIGAGGAANITGAADPFFGTDNYQMIPNNSGVIYTFEENATSGVRLEYAPLTGSATVIYNPGTTDPPVGLYRISPDSSWVVFQTGTGTFGQIRSGPSTGGSTSAIANGRAPFIMPNSTRVVYLRSVDVDQHTDLTSVQIFGGGERNLSGLGGTGYALSATSSPDGNWIAFVTQIDLISELRVSDGMEAQPHLEGLSATNDGPGEVSQPISLTATITAGTVSTYTWDFGDGESGEGASLQHAYGASGIYTATVTAIADTNTLTATTVVYVGDAIVEVSNNKYTPANVTVEEGGTVIWVLKQGFHSVTADDGSFEQLAGSDWPPFMHVFTTTAAGVNDTVFKYHCSVHGLGMSGTVTVSPVVVEPDNKVLLPMVER